jgi:hypothetical protein
MFTKQPRLKQLATALLFFVLGGLLLATPLMAQDPSSDAGSVADAARKAREQKKASAKPATVITDDNIKPAVANTKLGTVSTSDGGNAPAAPDANAADSAAAAPAAENGAAPASAAPAAAADDEEKKKQVQSLQQQIADKQTEVDTAQREFALENDNYYSKTNYAQDKDGKAKLDALQADLSAKKDELAKLKAQLSDLGGAEQAPTTTPPTKQYTKIPGAANPK